MITPARHCVELAAPAGCAGVELTFAPTRSVIRDAQVSWPEGPDRGGQRTFTLRIGDGPQVRIEWRPELGVGQQVVVCLDVAGEPLRDMLDRWLGPADLAGGQKDGGRDRWQKIYDGRRQLSENDPEQAFLFELDRLTLAALLQFCDDLDDTEKTFRAAVVNDLKEQLYDRLFERWDGSVVGPVAPRERVAYVSAIFRRAAHKLDCDPRCVQRTLTRFAAGNTHKSIRIVIDGHAKQEIVSEPDSYFIFMFAELALVAIEHDVDRDFWCELLPTLVMMQEIYIVRYRQDQPDDICVDRYGLCGDAPLDPDKLECIRRKYAGLKGCDEELKTRVRQNLKQASKTCFKSPFLRDLRRAP